MAEIGIIVQELAMHDVAKELHPQHLGAKKGRANLVLGDGLVVAGS